MAVRPNLRVKERIENLTVFDSVFSQASFQNETGLLKDSSRSGIIRVRLGVNAMKRKFLEAIVHERRDHFGRDPVSPKFLT